MRNALMRCQCQCWHTAKAIYILFSIFTPRAFSRQRSNVISSWKCCHNIGDITLWSDIQERSSLFHPETKVEQIGLFSWICVWVDYLLHLQTNDIEIYLRFSLIMMKAKHQAWFAGWHITHNSWTHIIHAWCSLRPHFIWCRYVKWIIRKLHIKMRIQSKTCYFVYMNC